MDETANKDQTRNGMELFRFGQKSLTVEIYVVPVHKQNQHAIIPLKRQLTINTKQHKSCAPVLIISEELKDKLPNKLFLLLKTRE